jgi:SET domain-containing protein
MTARSCASGFLAAHRLRDTARRNFSIPITLPTLASLFNAMTLTRTKTSNPPRTRFIVRNSRIHGRGIIAARAIPEGERIIEYKGRIISVRQADRRRSTDPNDENHTFLFALSDGKRVIDANIDGNAARWINHSCEPNCETEESDHGRVYINAIRDIRKGEELHYDYCLTVDQRITANVKKQYECRCGSGHCRGTMLSLRNPTPSQTKGIT